MLAMKSRCFYCYGFLDNEGDFHAKCSLEFFGTEEPPILEYSLDQMNELAKEVIERSVAVPGVQPKLSLSILDDVNSTESSRLTVVGALGGNYIFKPPSNDYPEMPQNEHLTMRIAEAFGISVVQSSLIRLASGELSYITKRIDRTSKGGKIHMLDMFQITEAFDKYKSSMEKIGKALDSYSQNKGLDKIFFFELTLFSFIVGNNDMHLKNFSMILRDNKWLLAPAYDLLNVVIVNPSDTEEMALTVNGKKNKLAKADFEALGKNMGLTNKQISGVFDRMIFNKKHAVEWIEKSFLSNTMRDKYLAKISENYQNIN